MLTREARRGMEEHATILRLRPAKKPSPREAPSLQRKVSKTLPRSTLRITRGLIEIITFTKPSQEQLRRLEEELGAKLEEYREPGIERLEESNCLLDTYTQLLRENRFWEAHVIGEAIWRRRGVLGKHLAALAGAYAKAQEGLAEAARKVLERALSDKELRSTTSKECLFEELAKTYETGTGNPARCLDQEKLRRLLLGKKD